MKKTIRCIVTAVPVQYPDQIQLVYHVLSPNTGEATGEAFRRYELMQWKEVRRTFFASESHLDSCQELLDSGHKADVFSGIVEFDLDEGSAADSQAEGQQDPVPNF